MVQPRHHPRTAYGDQPPASRLHASVDNVMTNYTDSVLRPVARLLLTERLVTDQAASRIDSFALGPSHQGARRLRAIGTPPQVYVNQPDPAPVSIDGTVTDL